MLLLALAWTSVFAFAQMTEIQLSGTVTEATTGAPVPNHLVNVVIDSLPNTPGYYGTAITGDNGQYNIIIQIPGTNLSGIAFVFTYDANGMAYSQNLFFGPGNYNLIADFAIGGVTPFDCFADFGWWQTEELMVSFQDYSWPVPNTWDWNFGDGTTSTEQNPVHQYAETGVYFVTLTVFVEELNCESTTSYEVWVDNINYDCEAFFAWVPSWQAPLTIEFWDLSWFTPGGTWTWEFGDGTTSSEQNPVHLYPEIGEYLVTLVIESPDGSCYDTYQETIFVEEYNVECFADFWGSPIPGSFLTYQFQDFSFPFATSWEWNFGDGTTSLEQNPVHSFGSPGIYNVCLTMINQELGCEDTRCYEFPVDTLIYNQCYADFKFFPVSELTMQFADLSFPVADTWFWDFGDNNVSQEPNPLHTYTQQGIYMVCLTIENFELNCVDTRCYEVWVGQNGWDCQAQFYWLPAPDNSLKLEFYDISYTNGEVSYFWEFGDGEYSFEQNPVHVFPEEGEYYTCLTISAPDSSCYSQMCNLVYVGTNVPPDCQNDFVALPLGDLSFQFEGFMLNGQMGEFYWDFGDGNTGTGYLVTHTFATQGTYPVCLTTYLMNNPADSCIWTTCHEVIAGNGGPGMLQANFEVVQDSTTALLYHFFDTSTGQPAGWLWDFGDGTTSSLQNPTHLYEETGWYQVCLTVFGMGMTSTFCQEFEMSATFLGIDNENWGISSGQVFPNPNKGAFLLDLQLKNDEQVEIQILNSLGQVVYYDLRQLAAGNNQVDFELTGLRKGIYCVFVTSNHSPVTRKFIIE